MTTLKQRIKDYLDKKADWVNGGEIERLAQQVGYKASTASRICRELAEIGDIEHKYQEGTKRKIKTVWYRSKTPKKRVVYYVDLPEGRKEIVKYE